MTHPTGNSSALDHAMELLSEFGLAGVSGALECLLNEVMKLERSHFLQAKPYERTAKRRGHANGFKDKQLRTRTGKLELRVPQVRGLPADKEGFYPQALERGIRSERALTLAIAEMYVQGVSTRKVMAITQELCGFEISSTQVSRAAKQLDEELEAWRQRPLGEVPYLFLDARYEKVRHGGTVVSCALLVALGVRSDGRRTILGVSVGLSEAAIHWRGFLDSFLQRGLSGVRLVVSAQHAGLQTARMACFPGIPWQRCQVHLQRNARAQAPRAAIQKSIHGELRTVFDSSDLFEAKQRLSHLISKYQETAPQLASWLEENVPQGLTVLELGLPDAHRKRLRSTNVLERTNREIRRRTAVASIFPNDSSLLRLASAVLAETSEEWETAKRYLTMEDRTD